jgi:hypothetical protein
LGTSGKVAHPWQTRSLQWAAFAIVALGAIGLMRGIVAGYPLRELLSFALLVGVTGGVLMYALWWIWHAPTRHYAQGKRSHLLGRSLLAIVFIQGTGTLVAEAFHKPQWAPVAMLGATLGALLWMHRAARSSS